MEEPDIESQKEEDRASERDAEIDAQAEGKAREEEHPEQDVIAMLLKLPSDIKALELDLLDMKSREDVLENFKSRIESETMSKVSDELIPILNDKNEVIDGKPRFSNEQKRQSETALRNSHNTEYLKINEGLLTSKIASKKIEIGLKWRLNQLSAYKRIAELMAARQ